MDQRKFINILKCIMYRRTEPWRFTMGTAKNELYK